MNPLASRYLVAAIGIPLLVACTRAGGWWCLGLVIALQFAALLEWRAICHTRAVTFPFGVAAPLVAAIDFAMIRGADPVSTAILASSVALAFLSEVFNAVRRPLERLSGLVMHLVYVAIPFAIWIRLDSIPASANWLPSGALLTLIVSTWSCDVFAFMVGRKIGKRKLYPAASPNKTVEGFVGGLMGAALVVVLIAQFQWAEIRLIDALALVTIVGVFGQFGDLLESLIKRELGVKDSSNILLGHGGVLDRFDGLLVSTPLFCTYLLVTSH